MSFEAAEGGVLAKSRKASGGVHEGGLPARIAEAKRDFSRKRRSSGVSQTTHKIPPQKLQCNFCGKEEQAFVRRPFSQEKASEQRQALKPPKAAYSQKVVKQAEAYMRAAYPPE